MPKTKRDYLKRTTAQAYHNIERAIANIQKLHEVFLPHHPDYAQYLELIAHNLVITQGFILDFWKKAWGKLPKSLDSYRIK